MTTLNDLPTDTVPTPTLHGDRRCPLPSCCYELPLAWASLGRAA